MPIAPPPDARDDPPWGECGNHRSPDFGALFVQSVAGTAVALFYDRARRRHAVTMLRGLSGAAEMVVQGRRFTIDAGGDGR